jgi:exopolyphosphatase/guanosine-5'-triphosphate,3'-diphosphate pyrophosphatase
MSSGQYPFRVGCVDSGSNAIRFFVAKFTGPTDFETLAYERVPVRLGHQVFLTGQLAPQAMEGAVAAFASFRDQMKGLELDAFRAVTTSAVREAENGQELVDRVMDETGIDLEMISGSEEARLVHLAVASRVDLTGGQWILTDLGGGSVEVSLVDDMGMLWTESHTMGSVRILEELSEAKADPGGFQKLLSDYVSTLRIPSPAQYWSPAGFVATGGNIEALANLAGSPRNPRGVARLPATDLRSAINLLSRLSFHESMFDEAHGLHVARLALSIFDQLHELHDLGSEDRRLLLVASILHEVGAFIGLKKHHKHSLYLLSHSELPGISPNEMLIVANIARYHRKNIPRDHHPDFMRLSERDRDRTTLLSAILRVANALDRAHLQDIKGIRVEVGKKDISLQLDGEGDLLLERWAVSQRTALFEKTFNRRVSISV